jgi:hypothetical protein
MFIVFDLEKCYRKPATYNHLEYALAKKLLDKRLARNQSGKHSSAFSHGGPVQLAKFDSARSFADPPQGTK